MICHFSSNVIIFISESTLSPCMIFYNSYFNSYFKGAVGNTESTESTYGNPWGSIVVSAAAVANCVFDSFSDMKERECRKASVKEAELEKEDLNHNNESLKEIKIYNQNSEKLENVIKDEKNEKKFSYEEEKKLLNETTMEMKGGVQGFSNNSSNNIYSESDELTNFYSEYVCLSLNLFSCCMTIREVHHVGSDTPIVGAIVGIIVAAINPLRTLLTTQEKKKTEYQKMIEDQWLIKPLIAALCCLDLCVKQVGYQVAFRESEGLGPITDIIEIFGTNTHLLPNLIRGSVKSVIDSALSLLCTISSNTRRNTAGPTESGIQVLYQQYFSKLCCKVFRCSFKELKFMWTHLLNLIHLAIDAEPAFLAQFLHSTYAGVLTEVLKKSSRTILLPSNCEVLLMPLTWLASSMSITQEGLAYVINNNFLPLVVQILVDPALCHPQGDGLSSDMISRFLIMLLFHLFFIILLHSFSYFYFI